MVGGGGNDEQGKYMGLGEKIKKMGEREKIRQKGEETLPPKKISRTSWTHSKIYNKTSLYLSLLWLNMQINSLARLGEFGFYGGENF